MADCEVGPSRGDSWEAWAGALDHRLANSRIGVHRVDAASMTLAPFHAAALPPDTLDVRSFAARHGLSEEVAALQIERLRAQSIYINDLYQVNVETVRAPFGEEAGDMFWMSIKHRDRGPVRDWRELQQIKNMIVGDEHEGFEVYPAESRLVDTANQYHLWVSWTPPCCCRWAIDGGRCWTVARQRRSVHGSAISGRFWSEPSLGDGCWATDSTDADQAESGGAHESVASIVQASKDPERRSLRGCSQKHCAALCFVLSKSSETTDGTGQHDSR